MIVQNPPGTTTMPIEDLLPLPSIHRLMHEPGNRTVAQALESVDLHDSRSWLVRKYMIEQQRPKYPVHVAPADRVLQSYANMDQRVLALPEELGSLWVGNGHRRIAIALDLGWTHIATTPDVFCSGPEYLHLRGTTPKVFKVSRQEAERLYPESEKFSQAWIQWARSKFEAAGWGHLI